MMLITPRICIFRYVVERLVHYVKNNFMPGRGFDNLVDLNVQALQWCSSVDEKEHGTTKRIPSEAWAEESLRALPPSDVTDRYLWLTRSVGLDGFVAFEGMRIGIDHNCRSKLVNATRDGNSIIVTDNHGLIVAQCCVKGGNKVYCHPEQWPSDYRSCSQPRQKA